MIPHRRSLLVFCPLTFICIFFFARRSIYHRHQEKVDNWRSIRPGNSEGAKGPKLTGCTENLDWLEPYNLTSPFEYVSRDIVTIPAPNNVRPIVTQIDEPLFDEFTIIDLSQSQTLAPTTCLPALTLEAPHGPKGIVDVSSVIFGLQTTMDRLKETVKHLARWLPHTGARLYCIVIVDEHTSAKNSEMRALEKVFRDEGMDVTLLDPVKRRHTFAQRYFSLVDVLYSNRDENTRWLTLLDDDTFFPSMRELMRRLSHYDPSIPQYIGSLSEDWGAVNLYGLMAFGGAGIVLSVPMAQILDENSKACNTHLRTTAGDITVMDCIYKFTPTKLTHINAMHQIDFFGDQSGFYESGREILSLHHWKIKPGLEMDKMHLVADICDNCFLQRWQFPHDLLLSNGYSITQYPLGHLSKKGGLKGLASSAKNLVGISDQGDKINLLEMEITWDGELKVENSLGPLRRKMGKGEKITFRLLDSLVVKSEIGDGKMGEKVRQIYIGRGTNGERDTVMVLNWKLGR